MHRIVAVLDVKALNAKQFCFLLLSPPHSVFATSRIVERVIETII